MTASADLSQDPAEAFSVVYERCTSSQSCLSCTQQPTECAWCYDQGFCVHGSEVGQCQNNGIHVQMDWRLNSPFAREVSECLGLNTGTKEHVKRLCQVHFDDYCSDMVGNCVRCLFTDQNILALAWKWIRSAFCAVNGVHTYYDIHRDHARTRWYGPEDVPIDFSRMVAAINDGIWTTEKLPGEYCATVDCCDDEYNGNFLLDKYRLIPDLDFCTDHNDRFPALNNHCDPRLDKIRYEDALASEHEYDYAELTDQQLAKRVAGRILSQLNALDNMGILTYLNPALIGPFYNGKYPEVILCEFENCDNVMGIPMLTADGLTSQSMTHLVNDNIIDELPIFVHSWLQEGGFTSQPTHERFISFVSYIAMLMVFFVVMPVLSLTVLRFRQYSHRKALFMENRKIRDRVKLIHLRLGHKMMTSQVADVNYRTNAALSYITERLSRDPMKRKLAQQEDVVEVEDSSSSEWKMPTITNKDTIAERD